MPPQAAGARRNGSDARLCCAPRWTTYYEYLSWLFDHSRLTVTDSREFFGARMIDGWRLGRHFLGQDELRLRYRELDRFVRDTPPTQRGDDPCRG